MARLPEQLQAITLLLALALAHSAVATDILSFWQQQLSETRMPKSFENLASPLSATLTEHYASQVKAGTLQASKNEDFCSSAGIYCQKAITIIGPQPRVCIPPFFFYAYNVLKCNAGSGSGSGSGSAAEKVSSSIFFSQQSLAAGNVMMLPSTFHDLEGLKFLPQSLTKALPDVNENSLPGLLKFYGVTEESDIGMDMQYTAAHCGFKSEYEVKTCVMSGEDLVSFVSKMVGHNAIALAPSAMSAQEATVQGVTVINTVGSKVATCHDMKFPSLLYSCHMTQSSQVMNVGLKLANGYTVEMPAICHMDTSYWNPSHVAFQVLNAKPGVNSVCHWFPQNSFIFVEGSK